MKLGSFIILSLFYFNSAAVENLRIPDIRSMGMGGNGVTQSIWFNPALISLSASKSIHFKYFNRYNIKELGTMGVSFVYPNSRLSAAVHISSFGYSQYRESTFRISVSKQLNRHWYAGISFQCDLLQTELLESTPKRVSADFGVVYKPFDKLLIGMLIMDFPSFTIQKETTDIKYFSGYSLQVGFQYKIINSLLIAISVATDQIDTWIGNVGLEYAPYPHFHIRAGLQTTPLLPTVGVGYRIAQFTLNAVSTYHTHLGVSYGVELHYSF